MADGELAGTFSRNLVPLKGARQHPDQMAFWLAYPEAFRFATLDPVPPDRAMREYDESVQDIASNRNARPVFVAYPAGLDWTFVYWYLMRFVKESPFGFQALDTKSFAMAVLGTEFTRTKKGRFPKSWKHGGEAFARGGGRCHQAGPNAHQDAVRIPRHLDRIVE